MGPRRLARKGDNGVEVATSVARLGKTRAVEVAGKGNNRQRRQTRPLAERIRSRRTIQDNGAAAGLPRGERKTPRGRPGGQRPEDARKVG